MALNSVLSYMVGPFLSSSVYLVRPPDCDEQSQDSSLPRAMCDSMSARSTKHRELFPNWNLYFVIKPTSNQAFWDSRKITHMEETVIKPNLGQRQFSLLWEKWQLDFLVSGRDSYHSRDRLGLKWLWVNEHIHLQACLSFPPLGRPSFQFPTGHVTWIREKVDKCGLYFF